MSRAHLIHTNYEIAKNKEKLPILGFQHEFMADPEHRKKAFAKYFYKLVSAKVELIKEWLRHFKNWSYMVKQSKGKSINKSLRVLRHLLIIYFQSLIL